MRVRMLQWKTYRKRMRDAAAAVAAADKEAVGDQDQDASKDKSRGKRKGRNVTSSRIGRRGKAEPSGEKV